MMRVQRALASSRPHGLALSCCLLAANDAWGLGGGRLVPSRLCICTSLLDRSKSCCSCLARGAGADAARAQSDGDIYYWDCTIGRIGSNFP